MFVVPVDRCKVWSLLHVPRILQCLFVLGLCFCFLFFFQRQWWCHFALGLACEWSGVHPNNTRIDLDVVLGERDTKERERERETMMYSRFGF